MTTKQLSHRSHHELTSAVYTHILKLIDEATDTTELAFAQELINWYKANADYSAATIQKKINTKKATLASKQ